MANMDRKLVAKTEQYEVAYFASKHGITAAEARVILDEAGRSRKTADQLADAKKTNR